MVEPGQGSSTLGEKLYEADAKRIMRMLLLIQMNVFTQLLACKWSSACIVKDEKIKMPGICCTVHQYDLWRNLRGTWVSFANGIQCGFIIVPSSSSLIKGKAF